MPIEAILKHFFDLPNIVKLTLDEMVLLQANDSNTNFINGSIWKKISVKFEDKIVIPYFCTATNSIQTTRQVVMQLLIPYPPFT